MTDYEHTTATVPRPVAWQDALGPGFVEFTRLVEKRLADMYESMQAKRPGTPCDSFQRDAGQIEALRWVLRLPNSQKPKPGEPHE